MIQFIVCNNWNLKTVNYRVTPIKFLNKHTPFCVVPLIGSSDGLPMINTTSEADFSIVDVAFPNEFIDIAPFIRRVLIILYNAVTRHSFWQLKSYHLDYHFGGPLFFINTVPY